MTNNQLTNCKGQSYNDSKWGTFQSAPFGAKKSLKLDVIANQPAGWCGAPPQQEKEVLIIERKI